MIEDFEISNANSKLGNEYKEDSFLPSIQHFQNNSEDDCIMDDSIIEDSDDPLNELYYLFDLFLQGNFMSIFDIDQYVNNNSDFIPSDSMVNNPENNFFTFIKALIEFIEKTVCNDESLNIISSSLHLLALLSHDKLRELNDYLSNKFTDKLIYFVQQQHYELVFNSLWCISNLIWVSEFSFVLFFNNKLFDILPSLLTSNDEKILTLCSLINQRSLILLESKKQKYTEELNLITNNLHLLFNCPFEIPRYYAISSISTLISINSNFLNPSTIQLYLSAAFMYKDSSDSYQFGQSLLIISDLLSTDNPTIYEEIKKYDQIIEILKKGINFISEPKYQCSSIKSLCFIIICIPEMHEKVLNFGLINDIIEKIANLGDFRSKERVIEAFIRILYNDQSPLQSEVFQKGGLEFLCDSLYYANDGTIEIIKAFQRLVSMPDPLGSECAKYLIDYGLIEMLDDSIESCEGSIHHQKDLIDNVGYLKDFLINFIQCSNIE